MKQLATIMLQVLRAPTDEALLAKLREETRALCKRFPVPGIEVTEKTCCSSAA